MRPDARRAALVGGAVLAYGAISPRVLPRTLQLPANLGAATSTVVLVRAWGRSWRDLGLAPEDLPRGLAVGAATVPVILGVLGAAHLLPAARDLFADERASDASDREARHHLLLRVPIEVALAEELVFRSALLALGRTQGGDVPAVAATSIAFGLWHVLPALESHRNSHGPAQAAARFGGVATVVAGTVAATALAGVAFALLRLRSRSVIAPVIAHTALNSLAFLATRRLGRERPPSGV